MFGFITLLGFAIFCAGVYGVFNGRLGKWELRRGQFGWIIAIGLSTLLGGAISGSFGNPWVGGLALLAWAGLWAGMYGLIRGRIVALVGRRKAAVAVMVSVILLFTAVVIQGLEDQAVAAKKAADEAAALEAKYQDALGEMSTRQWEAAIARLTALGQYKNAPALLQEANYQEAADLVTSQQWEKAIQRLSSLGTYKDSASLLDEAHYRRVETAVMAKTWLEAKELLAKVPAGYKEVDALRTTVNDGLTAQYYAEAMKAKGRTAYVEAESLLLAAKSAGGKALADLDAEINTVVNLRVKSEQEAARKAAEEKAKAERIASEAGTKPENSSWDAAVAPVVAFLKRNLKDPDSVQYIEWSPVTLIEWKGKYAWGVRCRYRAKNSFGGYVIEEQLFFIRHGQVVDVTNF